MCHAIGYLQQTAAQLVVTVIFSALRLASWSLLGFWAIVTTVPASMPWVKSSLHITTAQLLLLALSVLLCD